MNITIDDCMATLEYFRTLTTKQLEAQRTIIGNALIERKMYDTPREIRAPLEWEFMQLNVLIRTRRKLPLCNTCGIRGVDRHGTQCVDCMYLDDCEAFAHSRLP